MLKSMQQ